MQACAKTHHFEIKNAKIFWGRGHRLPIPHPLGNDGSSIFAPTALKLNVSDTSEKILVTALSRLLRGIHL